jgi:hypothetical protein
MNKKLINKILKVLVRQIGDHRQCPSCHKAFIPQDRTQKDCIELYKEIKKLKDENDLIKL